MQQEIRLEKNGYPIACIKQGVQRLYFLIQIIALKGKSRGHSAIKGPNSYTGQTLTYLFKKKQSLVLYNHASRQGAIYEQITKRLSEIKVYISYGSNAFAMLWRKFGVRYYLVVPTDQGKNAILSTCQEMIEGPWGQRGFFELVTIERCRA